MIDNIQFDLIVKKNQNRWFERFFGVPWYRLVHTSIGIGTIRGAYDKCEQIIYWSRNRKQKGNRIGRIRRFSFSYDSEACVSNSDSNAYDYKCVLLNMVGFLSCCQSLDMILNFVYILYLLDSNTTWSLERVIIFKIVYLAMVLRCWWHTPILSLVYVIDTIFASDLYGIYKLEPYLSNPTAYKWMFYCNLDGRKQFGQENPS